MKAILYVAALSAAVPALAQPAPTATLVDPVRANILRSGTEVPLRMREELTTKKKAVRVGQRFQMEVASSIYADGVVVIPAGTPAVGEVVEVRNKGMWGKSGYIGARAVSMRVGDRTIRLTGSFDDKGTAGTGGVVAAAVLIPVAGFFMTGTSGTIPSGAGVKAYLDEDIAYQASAANPQSPTAAATQPPPK